MGTIGRSVASVAAIWLMLATFVVRGDTAEENSPEFNGAIYYGGSGNQGAWFSGHWGMGIATDGQHLYLAGVERALSGNYQTLGVKCAVPPGPAPVWTLRWPNNQNIQGHYPLPGIAVAGDGVYFVGQAKSSTVVSRYGVWANTSVLVKYPRGGPTGPEVGGALWVAKPVFFPSYNGHESLLDVIAVNEGGATVLYAAGLAEAAEDNQVALLAKFDLNGTLLWWKALGEAKTHCLSHGLRVAALNGALYVTGTVNPNTLSSWGNWRADLKPALWKVDPDGHVVWMKAHTTSVLSQWTGAVAALGEAVYVATTRYPGADGNSDVLLLKYDSAGALLWSKSWGTTAADEARGIAGLGTRLYVVGETRGWVGGGEKDVFLLELDGKLGEVLSANYHGGKFDDRAFRALVVGPDLYVIGDSYSNTNFANLDVMLLRYTLSQPPRPLTVAIDIKPGSEENPIQPTAPGKIPVAILSTAAFDAPSLVDRATVTFGRTGTEKSLAASGCTPEDVNGDGRLDLICHAETLLAAFQAGDTQGVLQGKTLDGRAFLGTDRVTIVPHQEKKAKEPPKHEAPKRTPAPRVGPPPVTPPVAIGRSSPDTEAEALKRLHKEGGVAY